MLVTVILTGMWVVCYSESNSVTRLVVVTSTFLTLSLLQVPSFLNSQGVVQCGTAASPIPLTRCVPWNPLAGFGAGTEANSLSDPAVQAFLFPTTHNRGQTTTAMYFANIGGLLFTLPAGDVTFAVGTEHRKEDGEFVPDALAQSGASSTLAAGATKGTYDLDEYYAELNVPILAHRISQKS